LLVVVSDLHLTDGSTAIDVDPSAFDLLRAEIESTARQRDAKDLHVVLLGDIFDLVRTSWWHEQEVPAKQRPWGGTLDPATGMNAETADVERQFGAVLGRILAQPAGRGLLKALEGMGRPGAPVQVTYVVGNHDRVLNNFPALRTQIAAALDPAKVTLGFANALSLPEYGVLARHGHEWDDNCHGWKFLTRVLRKGRPAGRFDPECYQVMAIGEAVTAELMGGLVYHVARRLDPAREEDALVLQNLKDVNNLRPMTEALKWVEWFSASRGGYVRVLRDALLDALDGLLESSLAARWNDIKHDIFIWGDLTYFLRKARAALRDDGDLHGLGDMLAELDKIKDKLGAIFGHSLDDLGKGAEQEFADPSLPGGTQYVVYGHTHVALNHCFHAERGANPGGGAVQMYINTGTYLPLVERALDGRSYVRSGQMTMLAFFRREEDAVRRADDGPTLDLWNGMRRKSYR